MKTDKQSGVRLLGKLIMITAWILGLAAGGKTMRAEETPQFYLDSRQEAIQPFSFDNTSTLTINSERYDRFAWDPTAQGDKNCPHLALGIKYVVGDNQNPDGGGKWRNVYCLEFEKASPTGQTMTYAGFTNRKVAYALYYGAVYYGYPCRYEGYSTGDWKKDYFVTQMAIHILNDEFTLSALHTALFRAGSEASVQEKEQVYDRIRKLVNDAGVQGNYGGFTRDGWIDMGTGTFGLTGYRDGWKKEETLYRSQGVFQAIFESYYGYDFREQITSYDIESPEGVTVRKSDNKTYSDFYLTISERQFAKWQLAGKTIPVTVTMKIPRYWGGGIYQCGNGVQDICFLTWSSAGGETAYSKTVDLHIPPKLLDLTIYKKDAGSGAPLTGAGFSLWAYDGQKYSKKVRSFSDNGDGSYTCADIDYTSTQDGWFLIKEEKAPEGYSSQYRFHNSVDQSDYSVYQGRQVRMTEDGMIFDGVDGGETFLDEKLPPQASLQVKKYDAVSGDLLENAVIKVFAWDQKKESYLEQPLMELEYDKNTGYYVSEIPLTADENNLGKFLIKETKMPHGYRCPWSQEILVETPGLTTMRLDAPNEPVRSLLIRKQIKADDVNWAHGNPTFFFRIWGKDTAGINREYFCWIEITPEDIKGEVLENCVTVENLPAGNYQVEEEDSVLRYILTGITAGSDNVAITTQQQEIINGIPRITGFAACDLVKKDAEVLFCNEKIRHDRYSDNQILVNEIILS